MNFNKIRRENNLLKHDNSLHSNLQFDLLNDINLFERIDNPQDKHVYALIACTVTSNNNKFNPIHIMYLLNLNTFEFEDISVSDNKFKANDAKTMIRRCDLDEGTVIITLNNSPFTTNILTNYFKTKNYKHIYYNKNHFTPMIDYTKYFLQGMIMMFLLTNKSIDDKDIKNLAAIWNTEEQPIMKKIADSNNIKPNLLYFK